MIKAIIWDLDGTLVDSEKHHVNAEIATMREFGVPLTHDVAVEYLGYKLEEYFAILRERYEAAFDLEAAISRHRQILDEYYESVFPLVPHAREVLIKLNENSVPMALATNATARNARSIVARYELAEMLSSVIGVDEVRAGKPDPEMFLVSAERMNVLPGEVVVVEDSESGFHAAKAAGMKLIARRAGHNKHGNFDLADFVIEDLLEVPDIIDGR